MTGTNSASAAGATRLEGPCSKNDEVITTSLDIWAELELSSAHILGNDYSTVLRRVENVKDLRSIAAKIALAETSFTPYLLDVLGLPQLESPSFWVTEVLPAIRKEIDRRIRPAKEWGLNSPIARIKANHRVEDVAEQFTRLRNAGKGMKGLCPLHQEKSPSFYVWPDSQRWKCFGACGTGGDVVDLLRRLGQQGRLA